MATSDGVPIETLIRIDAGLRAELDVLRSSGEVDIIEDAQQPYTFRLADAQLDELKRAREVLQEEVDKTRFVVRQRLEEIRSLNAEELASKAARDLEGEEANEASLRAELRGIRKRALMFAKEQWPVSQDDDRFEGGDFWDACVAACSTPEMPIEYSMKEANYAELLIQSGVADRIDDSGGMMRIKLAKELYNYV